MPGERAHLTGNKFYEVGDNLIFIVKAIDDRVPQELLPQFAKDLWNLPIFWRHQTPQKKEFGHQPAYGKVLAAKEYPGGVMAIGKLYGSSEMPEIHARRRALVELVKKHGQMGFDLGLDVLKMGVSSTYDSIKVTKNNQAKVVEVHPFELSVTPWPACDSCVIKMSEQPVKKVEENDGIDAKKVIEDALKNATIEELTELLNKKTLELEETKEQLREKEQEAVKSATELESKVKTLEGKVEKLVTELESERKAKIDAERAPYISQLQELDKNGLFDADLIASMDTNKIKDRIVKLTKENEVSPKIVVTSMQHTAEENQKKEDPPSPKEVILKKMESCEKGTAIYKKYEEELAKLG